MLTNDVVSFEQPGPDWLGKPRYSYAVSGLPDKLDIKGQRHGILY